MRYAPDTIFLKTRSEVKVAVTQKWYLTPPLQDASTHQIWNYYLKEYRRYAPDSMLILETRSEITVTVTYKWYTILRHPKMHSHTKFVIHTSNNIRGMFQTQLF